MTASYIIAEIGVNHNGSLERAKKLITAAKKAGADAVKFQTFKTDELFTPSFSGQQLGSNKKKQKNFLISGFKKLELSFADFIILKKYAESKKIDFLSTADDFSSLNFLVKKLKLKKIKIGSGEVNNLLFLKKIAKLKTDLIVSSGASTLAEVKQVVRIIKKHGTKKIALLHCTSLYPAKNHELNLKAIQTLRQKIKIPIGFSDHSKGILAGVVAVSLGASIIEKHLTLNKKLPGPDHSSSLNPREFSSYVSKIREAEILLGSKIKKPEKREKAILKIIRKKVVAAKNLPANKKITLNDILCKRSNIGLAADLYKKVLHKKIKTALKKNDPILLKNIF